MKESSPESEEEEQSSEESEEEETSSSSEEEEESSEEEEKPAKKIRLDLAEQVNHSLEKMDDDELKERYDEVCKESEDLYIDSVQTGCPTSYQDLASYYQRSVDDFNKILDRKAGTHLSVIMKERFKDFDTSRYDIICKNILG